MTQRTLSGLPPVQLMNLCLCTTSFMTLKSVHQVQLQDPLQPSVHQVQLQDPLQSVHPLHLAERASGSTLRPPPKSRDESAKGDKAPELREKRAKTTSTAASGKRGPISERIPRIYDLIELFLWLGLPAEIHSLVTVISFFSLLALFV